MAPKAIFRIGPKVAKVSPSLGSQVFFENKPAVTGVSLIFYDVVKTFLYFPDDEEMLVLRSEIDFSPSTDETRYQEWMKALNHPKHCIYFGATLHVHLHYRDCEADEKATVIG